MHSGALYLPMDEALFQEQLGWLDRLWEFNATRPSQLEKREALLAVLAQDPRPSYQEDPDRVYGMAFAGLQVRFTAGGGRLRVVDISK